MAYSSEQKWKDHGFDGRSDIQLHSATTDGRDEGERIPQYAQDMTRSPSSGASGWQRGVKTLRFGVAQTGLI